MFFFLLSSSLSSTVNESLFNSLSIYQVMVSSFQNGDDSLGYGTGYGPSHHKGDLRGIINSLQYIKDLGFNTLWMTPIFDSSNGQGGAILQSTGYFATNYFKVDPKFGSEDMLKELITKAHNLGLYVLLDGVFGHHGGVNTGSPNGNWPQGGNNPVSYPGSLAYFQEAARYWIENYEIDGWRLDQSYQMYQNGYNYLKELRETVYSICEERRNAGKQWGILGYMVGEDWEGISDINTKAYGGDGLRSAFDFPYRYSLIQALAQEESGGKQENDNTRLNYVNNVLQPPSNKGYPSNVYPNMFLDNHDLWRFGNLIRNRYNIGKDNVNYWKFYKLGISALAVYTGPITLYYGNEIGDITDCWYNENSHSCGSNTYRDNCARTNGQISGFDSNQQDLHDFTAKILNARLNHPAMWRGSYSSNINSNYNAYFNCKYDSTTKDKILYAFSLNWASTTVNYDVGGTKLVDLVTGEIIYRTNNQYTFTLDGVTPRIFEVIEDTPTPTASPAPTAYPAPTASPVPTAYPAPTASPVPTASPTPKPTATPHPTKTPKPTHTPDPVNPSMTFTEESEESEESEVSQSDHQIVTSDSTKSRSNRLSVIASIVVSCIALIAIIGIFVFLFLKRDSYKDKTIMEPLSVP